MNRDFVIFEHLQLSQARVALLLLLVLLLLLIILAGALFHFSTNIFAGLVFCCVGLLLVYGLGFSRYRISGYVKLHCDMIEVIEKSSDQVSSFQISKIKSIKLKINGVYNVDPAFQGILVGSQGNTSKKAISKLVIETESEEKGFVIRAKGMDFRLLEEILDGYKASGIIVKATIFK